MLCYNANQVIVNCSSASIYLIFYMDWHIPSILDTFINVDDRNIHVWSR